MSRKTELAKNTAILTVGKLCTQCISFFLLPLYTAILSTEEYGTFDLLVTYSTLLLPLVNWQLDQGLFRFMLDHRGNKEEQGKLFSTLLLSSTVQSVIYIILFICVEPFLKIENAYFLLLYVVLHVYTALFLQFVRGLGYSVKYTGDQDDLDARVARQRLDERMDGAAELEVAAEADRHVVETPLFALDRQQARTFARL